MNAMKSLKGILSLRKNSKGNALIPIIVVIVATPLLTYVMFEFVMMPRMKKMLAEPSHGEHAAGAHAEGDHGEKKGGGHGGHGAKTPKTFERITANLAGEHRTRFIIVDFSLYGSHDHFETIIDENKAKIQHAAISYLSSVSLKEINDNRQAMHDKMSKELKRQLNQQPGIDGAIDELYFTAFNIQ
jgi:flagellar basal body-associated protein FliL